MPYCSNDITDSSWDPYSCGKNAGNSIAKKMQIRSTVIGYHGIGVAQLYHYLKSRVKIVKYYSNRAKVQQGLYWTSE